MKMLQLLVTKQYNDLYSKKADPTRDRMQNLANIKKQ
jgi:hypothetical protein